MASASCLCSRHLGNDVLLTRDLSSSAAFVSSSPLSCYPPAPKPSASKLLTAKCSLSEQDQPALSSVGRRAFAGVVATGAALAVFTNMAIAAQGPGNEGARRVAEKADKLLKAADKLNIEDAPKRFGPGRSEGGDPSKISQIAGSGPVTSAKQGASDAAKGASDAVKKLQNKGDGFFGGLFKKQNNVADNAKGALSEAKGKTDEVVGNVRQAINRDGFGRFRVPKDVSSNVEGAFGQAQNKKSQLGNSAKGVIRQAEVKTDIGGAGGNVLSSIKEGIQGLKENITETTEDVKKAF